MVTADDFIQSKTGFSASGTSFTVSLDAGTADGTTVLIFVYAPTASSVSAPAEFIRAFNGAMSGHTKPVSAGETSWAFTTTVSSSAAWYAVEMSGLSLTDPFEVTAVTSGSTANGATRSTNTTALNAGSSTIGFALFGTAKAASGDVQSWSGYTNGFTELVDVSPAGATGAQLAVAYNLFSTPGTYETTATFATTAAAPTAQANLVLFRSGDATINAPLAYLSGFEYGTHAGMGNSGAPTYGPQGTPPGGHNPAGTTWGTDYLVQAGSARNGGYGLRVAPSASVAAVNLPTAGSGNRLAAGFNMRVVSATGTVTVAEVQSSGADLSVMYDSSTSKVGLVWAGGSTVWQTGTTPLNTWAWVDFAMLTASPIHTAKWSIETGTGDGSQTSPADLTGQSVTSSLVFRLGSNTSQTCAIDYDDVVIARHYAAYPLGPHNVTLLVPETTGASVSGTSGNFNEFTANGTLAAFASTSGSRIDEVPPTISASSDGVVQVTLAASDYMNFPMTTYTCDPNEIIAGVRAVASLWGGTGTGTGTLGFRGYDGTTETTFVAASTSFDPDSLTTASATYPLWYTSMWTNTWTQTKLNAAALRLGFSTDATPDMGASAMYLEVATRTIVNSLTVHRLTNDEDPEVNAAVVTETLHPYTSGVRTFSVSNDDPTRTAVFNYSISGTPQTPVTVAPSDPPVDVTVGVENFGDVDSTSFSWQ